MSDLSKVPFLAQLSAADLADLERRMEKRTYEAGDLIYAEGTPGDGLYYIESGAAVVLTGASCDGEIMAHLPAGSTFGETALISDRPRSSAVRAAGDCTIMLLAKTAYAAFLAERPAAGKTVSQTLLSRPQRSARQIMNELLRPMPAFAKVNEDALLGIARKLQSSQVCANSTVFAQGEPLNALYIVEAGLVRLEASGALLSEVGPRDFFGEDAMLTDEPSEMTAVAVQGADLWSLDRDAFDSIVNAYPAAAIALTRALAARSEHLNRKLVALATAGAPAAAAATAAMPTFVAVPVPFAAPAPAPKPAGPSLAARLSGLSLAGKAAVATAAVLLVWLLAVSIPSAIGSGSKGVDQTRDVATTQSARGASVAARLGERPYRHSDRRHRRRLKRADGRSGRHRRHQDPGAHTDHAAGDRRSHTDAARCRQLHRAERRQHVGHCLPVQHRYGCPGRRQQHDICLHDQARRCAQYSGRQGAGRHRRSPRRPRPRWSSRPPPLLAAPAAPAAAPAVAAAAPEAPSLPFVWDGRLDKLNIRVDQAAVAARPAVLSPGQGPLQGHRRAGRQ